MMIKLARVFCSIAVCCSCCMGDQLVKPQFETHLCWWQERSIERRANTTSVFSWRQCFDLGREGDNWTFRDRPTIHLTIARLALRISGQWYLSHRVSSVYQERSGVWEQKTFVLGKDKLWVKISSDLRTDKPVLLDVPGLSRSKISALGIYNDQMVGEHRIDAFNIRRVQWKPSVPQPNQPGAWPQYKRNAARQGNAPEEQLVLPLKRVAAWRFPAPIYASPAVINGRVFVQDASGHVACLDYTSRRVVWQTNIDSVANHSSPAIAHGRVFIGSTAGYLAILEASTGELLKKVPGPGGVISSPAVERSAVFFSPFQGKLFKIDFSGRILWTYDPGLTSITEFAVRGNEVLFYGGRASGHPDLDRLMDLGTEVLLAGSWGGHCPSGGPVFGPDCTAVGQMYDSEWGTMRLFSWSGDGDITPWRYNDLNDSRSTPSIRGNRIYRGDKCFALSANDKGHARVLWQADPKMSCIYGGGFHSSPALSKQYQIVGGEDGYVYFFRLDPKADETSPPVRVWGVNKVKDKVRVNKPVWAFRTEGAGTPNGAVSSSPAVTDGRVFFGGEDGILYVLGSDEQSPVFDLQTSDNPASSPVVRTHSDLEWHTTGGDMGYSFVSPDQIIRPPFRIKWKTRVWGSFKGQVIVAKGQAFCASRLGQVTALDAETGRIVWRTSHPRLESRPGPTYADGKLLVLRGSLNQRAEPNVGAGLWCHDAKTGRVIWQKPVPFAYQGNADGLVVHEGKVLVAANNRDGVVVATAYALEDGSKIWDRRYENLLSDKPSPPVRICGVVGDGRWYLNTPERWIRGKNKPADGITLAIDPCNGERIWMNRNCGVSTRSRISFRKGVLVVFTKGSAEALDAATGDQLWTGHGGNLRPLTKKYYLQPLTDLYLNSKGTRGICLSNECSYSVFANGVWYGHLRDKHMNEQRSTTLEIGTNTALGARIAGDKPDARGVTVNRTIWEHRFLSNACPAPSPAYGRLYYTPNGEGLVYCFEPVEIGAP